MFLINVICSWTTQATGWHLELLTLSNLSFAHSQSSNLKPESNVRFWAGPIRKARSPGFHHIWYVIGRAAVKMMQRFEWPVEGFVVFHPASWRSFMREVQYLPAPHHSMAVTAWHLPPETHCLRDFISLSLLCVPSLFVMNINIVWHLPDAQVREWGGGAKWLKFYWTFRKSSEPGHQGESRRFPLASVCTCAEICVKLDLFFCPSPFRYLSLYQPTSLST